MLGVGRPVSGLGNDLFPKARKSQLPLSCLEVPRLVAGRRHQRPLC